MVVSLWSARSVSSARAVSRTCGQIERSAGIHHACCARLRCLGQDLLWLCAGLAGGFFGDDWVDRLEKIGGKFGERFPAGHVRDAGFVFAVEPGSKRPSARLMS